MAPENTPLDPNPAITRPTINTMEFGAAPDTADPISKIVIEAKKTSLES